MKLFGSKKALMKERIRQKAAGHWVIHPCSSFRFGETKYAKRQTMNPAIDSVHLNLQSG
ncbi:unnamed protein product [Acanthoscelides obtectus]|uniref:Ion transport N-terminal domain-containing protein n=1 Tax=Acanthoscelides obtectus TaxID=200917 RepID=A0A9P0LP70_ACAOB|nr:unnamed protein product [Acanthoscelides obtectus]CAK1658824.1 hypothetical protein AOBTE_LOCUS21149 [Acanthoscelides obtectus]